MTNIQIVAFVCFALGTLVLIGFAVAHLTRSEFLPYHREALGRSWVDVEAPVRALLLGLMRAVGGLALAVGLAMVLILLVPYRAGEAWASFALAAIAVSACAFSIVAMLHIKRQTAAHPPMAGPLSALALSAAGFLLSLI